MGYLIYAVDDEDSIRDLYTYALTNNDFKVETFMSAQDFYQGIENKAPDLVLLDIMLGDIDGLEVLQRLKDNQSFANIPVILVSAKGQEIDKVNGLNLGADDYISKPFGILELVARINASLRRTAKGERIEYKEIVIDDSLHTITLNNKSMPLTLKSYNLLKLLIQNAGKVVNRKEIFYKVWGDVVITETRTLDIHIKELRKHLRESSIEIETIRGVGYILR